MIVGGMIPEGMITALEGDVPIIKAFIRNAANGDRVLAESIYKMMIRSTMYETLVGTVVIIIGIPALLLLVGFIFIPVGFYMVSKAKKQRARITQAYDEWRAENS